MKEPIFRTKGQFATILIFVFIAILTFIGSFFNTLHALNFGLCIVMIWGTYKYW